jgi:(E)-4-hydroxy-3-methylbut-2-enyl-diphosphate synthase
MRRETVTVMVGELAMGSAFPVRVQSMLDASTMDTEACVAQAARVVEAGGELVRLAVPGVREAVNLGTIREAWRGLGYRVPLSADVHFSPEVAMVAARSADKVRVNPGNFPGGNDEDFEAGARRAREGFSRFLSCCRERGVAVRVGTNHGSLSGRITRRFGNTPEGMVEATMEFLRACAEEGFGEVVVSLKSSDCRVMVEAVRLLARRMEGEGMAFPLHLGVTEAGEGEDGRARSAVGIGTLLNEGLGDTIRVSLTEPPEREVAVARELIGCCRPLFRRDRRVLSPRCARPLVVGSGEAEAVVVPGGGAVVVEGVSLPVVGAGVSAFA